MASNSLSIHPQWATQFRNPGTELRLINGKYYLYSVSSKYDSVAKRTKKITGKVLGRITEQEGFIESGKRVLARKAEAPVSLQPGSVMESGFSAFVQQYCVRILERLKQYFPQHWAMMVGAVYCRLVHHSCIKNMPFHLSKSMIGELIELPVTDKKISMMLRHIGQNRQQATAYMQSFIKPSDYVMVDMTHIFSASTQISLAKEGYNSDLIYDKQFNLLYLYSPALLQPVFYRLYAGNIRDVKSFRLCLQESGIEQVIIVADKGFYSIANVDMLRQQQLQFIIPLRRDNSLIDYGKLDRKGSQYFKFQDRYIWYVSYRRDEEQIFMFKDERLRVQEEKDYLDRIETHPEDYSVEDFHQKKERFGTIAIHAHLDNPHPQHIYATYKSRNSIEVMFDGLKNVLDADKTYMQNEEALQGWMFINHIALQWYYILYSLLKERNLMKKYSVNDLITHLREIRKVKIRDTWQQEPITASTEAMLGKLGISVT